MKPNNHLICLFCAAFLANFGVAGANEFKSLQDKPDLVYEMKQGDTLLNLVARYFSGPDALNEIVRINQIKNVYKIPVGQKITLPRALLNFSSAQAHLTSIDCNEPIYLNGQQKELHLGDALSQGSSIQTPKNCNVAITLEDASTVNLMSATTLRIKTLRKNALEKSPEVELEVLAGRIELDVPKRQKGDAPYQVLTPSSLAGVRGTKFRVGVDASRGNSQVEVTQGNVGARGSADKTVVEVKDNMGLAIDSKGLAGGLEVLPAAPNYAGFERKLAAFKLKFDANSQAKYFLAKSKNANFSNASENEILDKLEIDSISLANKAVFYQMTPVSGSGLFGLAKHYGFCVVGATSNHKCSVNFNMRGMQTVNLHLEWLNPQSGAFEDVINADFTVSQNDQFFLKDLPEGQYRWQINFTVNGQISSRKVGNFDLIVIAEE